MFEKKKKFFGVLKTFTERKSISTAHFSMMVINNDQEMAQSERISHSINRGV